MKWENPELIVISPSNVSYGGIDICGPGTGVITCTDGTTATGMAADCAWGTSPASNCVDGTSAGIGCQLGNNPGNNSCDTGGGAGCNVGAGV